jgi:hypothetical protein
MKIASATASTATINSTSNTSNDPHVFDNISAVVYPTMFDRWSLPL